MTTSRFSGGPAGPTPERTPTAAPAPGPATTPFAGRRTDAGPSSSFPALAPGAAGSKGEITVERLLELMSERGASDLHLSVGNPPLFRVRGKIEPVRFRRLSNRDFVSFLGPVVPPELWKEYLRSGDADFSMDIPGLARFRVNLFMQERGHAAVFRMIPARIPTLEQLGLPAAVRKVAQLERGLVLVTGPAGSGKSTTLSALIHEINETRAAHIITIEDPIEFVHAGQKSIVTQREVGVTARSFADAMAAALREDPNVLLAGELRDVQTISLALHAAATGILVFGTLHTRSAAQAVESILQVFPEDEVAGIRNLLGEHLQAVVAQQLLPRIGGGLIAALEVMYSTPGMGTLVRDGKIRQLTSLIDHGRREGMIGMDESLTRLVLEHKVEPLIALDQAVDPRSFREAVGLPPEAELDELIR